MARRITPNTNKERKLIESLEGELLLFRSPSPGWRYRGRADYLLQHGEFFVPPDHCDRPPAWIPQFCYANAYKLAHRSNGELRYAEGVAISGMDTLHDHAWCVDALGRVVDPTWSGILEVPKGTAYFGVIFELRHVATVRRGPNKSASVLNDWRRGFPLFKK